MPPRGSGVPVPDAEPPLRLSRILAVAKFLARWRSGDRGRDATTPLAIPLLGWRDIFIRTWRNTRADNINVLAAGIAFYAFLAMLPLIAAIGMVYGFFAGPTEVIEQFRQLIGIIPGEAPDFVAERLGETIDVRGNIAFGLAAAFVLATYGAARSARSVAAALDVIYGEESPRSFVRRWGLALVIAVWSTGVLILALLAIAALGYVEDLLPRGSPLLWGTVRLAFWLASALGVSVGLALLYRHAPSRREARWRWIAPGALGAAALWLLATFGFGVYIANFARFEATYGALATVIILQVWLYLSALVMLLGAKLNAEIERQTRADTTVGPARKRGRRDAAAADQVGEVPELELD